MGNAGWNGEVGPRGTAVFGFQATTDSGDTAATGFTINDIAVGNHPAPPLPTLSVGDASVTEGNSGTQDLAFTVTLSAQATTPVTVAYATGDGTAIAGSDYTSASGTLTFAPGQTTEIVDVQVTGDTAIEGNETLTLNLSSPNGATIADGTATGTIINDDVAPPPPPPPLPGLSISNTSVVEGAPGASGTPIDWGWLSTSGNQIVDARQHGQDRRRQLVRLGNDDHVTGRPVGAQLPGHDEPDAELGFNTIRLPFSSDMLFDGRADRHQLRLNPDLQGLTRLQIMDKIVDYAGQIGLQIILDHHRAMAGDGPNERAVVRRQPQPGAWIADWMMLAERYAGKPTVIGADLHNEPHTGTWGDGGPTDWRLAADGGRQRHPRGQSQLADLRRGHRDL